MLLWIWVAVVALVMATVTAIAAKLTWLRPAGPAHVLVIPSKIGAFVRRPQLEREMNAKALENEMMTKSAGQASHIVSAVYENGAGVSGGAHAQIVLFIGGKLSGVTPGAFISSFTHQYSGSHPAPPGRLGGSAACVTARSTAAGNVALCTWADNDTFGVLSSLTMSVTQLSSEIPTIRPAVEHTAR
jgi:hypothetical protein